MEGGRFNRKFHESFVAAFRAEYPEEKVAPRFQTRATTPQLFASNEASRDIFQSVCRLPSGKRSVRRFRDRRRRSEKGKKGRERERERGVEIVIHAPISGICCRGTTTCCEMTRNATLFLERKECSRRERKISLSFSLFLLRMIFQRVVRKLTPIRPIFSTANLVPRVVVRLEAYFGKL